MDNGSWRPAAQADHSAGDAPSVDWRTQLQPEARQRIVNKIMETLKRHLPISIPEGLSELKKIAVRFEEKIYTAATNQSDYLRKISLKMLSMETRTNRAIEGQSTADSGDEAASCCTDEVGGGEGSEGDEECSSEK